MSTSSIAIDNNKLMYSLIEAFPQNIDDAINIALNATLTKTNSSFDYILICGMGGSGIGGKLVSSWVQDEISIPILFCQDYIVPNFVGSNTLIIASSNSGNTEETLSATEDGRSRGATIIAICSGGKLKEYCEKWSFDYIIVPGGNPPRSSLAFSIVQLIHVLNHFNLIQDSFFEEIKNAKQYLIDKKDEIQYSAKELAKFVQNKQLMIYSEVIDEPISIRARQQFNENSKLLVGHHVIPEMNHNELLGWTGGDSKFGVLFIDSGALHPKNYRRIDFTKTFIKNKTPFIHTIKSEGKTRIERSLYLIHIIDWSSLYIAMNNNIDSIEINVIEDLKNYLNQ